MAIEVVDLPPIMVIFYSYVSLPEGNKGPQLFEPLRFYPTEKKKNPGLWGIFTSPLIQVISRIYPDIRRTKV